MPLYAVVVLIVMSTLGPVLSVTASVKIARGNSEEQLRKQTEARTQQSESARAQACDLFAKLLDVYDETPPQTATGVNAAQAYRDYYNDVLLCVPPRRK